MDLKKAYEILKINDNDSLEEIKNKYKELVKKYHPDKYQDNPLSELAEEKLKEINEAYEILKNSFENKDSKEDYNKNFKDDSKEENENIVFLIFQFKWKVDKELIRFNELKKSIDYWATQGIIDYEKNYKMYGSLSEFIAKDVSTVKILLSNVFSSLIEVCIKNGYDMYDENWFIRNYFDEVAQEYIGYYNDCVTFSNELDLDREYQKNLKKAKDKIYGDSLGNMVFRGATNLYKDYSDNQTKDEVYRKEELLQNLKNSVKNAVYNCLDIIKDIIGIKVEINSTLSNSILINLNKYPEEQWKEKLLQALINNPYNKNVYLKILDLYSYFVGDVIKISKFFGVDVDYEINKIIDSIKNEFKNNFKENLEKGSQAMIRNIHIELSRIGFSLNKINKFLNQCFEEELRKEYENIILTDEEKAKTEIRNWFKKYNTGEFGKIIYNSSSGKIIIEAEPSILVEKIKNFITKEKDINKTQEEISKLEVELEETDKLIKEKSETIETYFALIGGGIGLGVFDSFLVAIILGGILWAIGHYILVKFIIQKLYPDLLEERKRIFNELEMLKEKLSEKE